jgi:hypothetical protein
MGVSDSGGAFPSSNLRSEGRAFAIPFSGMRVLPWYFGSSML